MLTVHHLRKSVSDRVLWLCEELGLDYGVKCYDREANMAAPQVYKALSAFGTAPVIQDGNLTLAESGAIVEYICNRHGHGRFMLTPQDPNYPDFLFWYHFANGSMVPAFMVEHVMRAAGVSESGAARSQKVIALIEARLGETEFLGGPLFTAADIMMVLPRFAELLDLTLLPNINAYIQRITRRPAWERAIAIGQ